MVKIPSLLHLEILLRTPEQGAESVVHAATAPITPSLDTLETNTNKSIDFIRSGGYYASTKGKCIFLGFLIA